MGLLLHLIFLKSPGFVLSLFVLLSAGLVSLFKLSSRNGRDSRRSRTLQDFFWGHGGHGVVVFLLLLDVGRSHDFLAGFRHVALVLNVIWKRRRIELVREGLYVNGWGDVGV